MAAPASAATLATRVGLARQKVNYHLHALEAHGLVRLAQERKWGGLTERLLVATAACDDVGASVRQPHGNRVADAGCAADHNDSSTLQIQAAVGHLI